MFHVALNVIVPVYTYVALYLKGGGGGGESVGSVLFSIGYIVIFAGML